MTDEKEENKEEIAITLPREVCPIAQYLDRGEDTHRRVKLREICKFLMDAKLADMVITDLAYNQATELSSDELDKAWPCFRARKCIPSLHKDTRLIAQYDGRRLHFTNYPHVRDIVIPSVHFEIGGIIGTEDLREKPEKISAVVSVLLAEDALYIDPTFTARVNVCITCTKYYYHRRLETEKQQRVQRMMTLLLGMTR